jgi:Mitochondrial ribosomal protein (VAR1)
MNNKNIQDIKPFIFTKKINNNYKVIPLNITTNTLGPIRYFPSATKEWFNSVYAFNINSIKNLSVADKILIKLIKSYFNFYFDKKVLKLKRLGIRFKRLAINKIFISKAELKHTSSKIIITLYVYNEERRVLIRKIKRLEAILFPLYSKVIQSQINNKPFSIEEKLNLIKIQENNILLINWLYELKSYVVQQIKLEENNIILVKRTNIKKEKMLKIENLNKDLVKLINIIVICENDPISFKYYENLYKDFIYKTHLDKEINIIAYYKLLLSLNKSKFENKLLSNLKPLIAKLYNKEVEFNIVNLKTLYLNSDIFTEAISLKLKNRDNKLLRVLKSSLSMVKFPKINKVREQYNNKKELWINKVSNLNINFIKNNYNNDILNKLLLDLFHNSPNGLNNEKDLDNKNLLSDFVLNSLKYKSMAGARLEAKGRLTRRFTASRSVFKIKWKGSLKNIDSSYKGLSSVMLRGHVRSNIQYSLINSKTRNGAFGLKGWISSK